MLDARFVPVAQWPGKKKSSWQQQKSPYRAGYQDTLDHLEKELNHLRAKDILIQAYFERKDIRNDGWPRSSARPKESGVILTFLGKDGKTLSMPCDTYRDWEANLRAIAFTLEDLRAINRRGVAQTGEQYRGWEQLPPRTAPAEMTREEAFRTLGNFSSVADSFIRGSEVYRAEAIRQAFLRTHPDKGGRHEDFIRVVQAKKILEAA